MLVIFNKHINLFRTKIVFRNILLLFVIIPFLQPTEDALSALFGRNYAHLFSRLLVLWNYISIVICIILFIYYSFKRHFKIQTITYVAVLLCGCLFVCTLFNGEFSFGYLIPIICNIICIFVLANIWSDLNFKDYIRCWYYYITFWMLINSFSMYIYYPYGVYTGGLGENNNNYYLFGLDNVSFLYSLAGLFLGNILYYDSRRTKKIAYYFSYFFIMFSYIYVQAGTALVIIFMYVLAVLLLRCHCSFLFKYSYCILFCGISFIFIVILNSLGFFEPLLNLIGKDPTFSGRTTIWATELKSLANNHLFYGYGVIQNNVQYILTLFGPPWLVNIGHLHNVVMHFLFIGGIPAAIIFLVLWINSLSTTKNHSNTKYVQLLIVQACLWWLTFMFEYRLEVYLFWIIPICIYYSSLLQK